MSGGLADYMYSTIATADQTEAKMVASLAGNDRGKIKDKMDWLPCKVAPVFINSPFFVFLP